VVIRKCFFYTNLGFKKEPLKTAREVGFEPTLLKSRDRDECQSFSCFADANPNFWLAYLLNVKAGMLFFFSFLVHSIPRPVIRRFLGSLSFERLARSQKANRPSLGAKFQQSCYGDLVSTSRASENAESFHAKVVTHNR